MSIFTKATLAIAIVAGAAMLPPLPTVQAAPKDTAVTKQSAPQKVAAISPAQAPSVAAAPVIEPQADQDCFMARKKSAKRKATSYVRLVKVCE